MIRRFINWLLGPNGECEHGTRFSDGVCGWCMNGPSEPVEVQELVEV